MIYMSPKKLFIYTWICRFIPSSRAHNFKCSLLRWAGAKVGKNVEIMSSAKILGDFDLEIGDNCFIGHEAMIFGPKGSKVIMENYSKVASRAIVVTGQHVYSGSGECVAKEGVCQDIIIKRGALVDTLSIVVPGKIIGEMSHVAAGSVVTKDVSPFVRVAGIPAKEILKFERG